MTAQPGFQIDGPTSIDYGSVVRTGSVQANCREGKKAYESKVPEQF